MDTTSRQGELFQIVVNDKGVTFIVDLPLKNDGIQHDEYFIRIDDSYRIDALVDFLTFKTSRLIIDNLGLAQDQNYLEVKIGNGWTWVTRFQIKLRKDEIGSLAEAIRALTNP